MINRAAHATAAPPKPIRRRTPGFEVAVSIHDARFMSAVTASQRTWCLDRAVGELADDLGALDAQSRRFVPGSVRPHIGGPWEASRAMTTTEALTIAGQQVMQSWEAPLMQAMAEIVVAVGGHVLEVGFGMGISATTIQELGTPIHTIVECNDDVLAAADAWRRGWPDRDVRLVKGRWQDVLVEREHYDAILFDTYPTSEQEFTETVLESTTFAQHFFPVAARLLRPGGIFTYYTNEIDSLSRTHQRLLLAHFRTVTVGVVRELAPPPSCNYWWADSMAVVSAMK